MPELSQAAFATQTVHAGTDPEPITGAINVPVFLTSTYVQPAPAQHKGYEYSRTGNPTRAALESAVAVLEAGTWGLCFASGMAATDAAIRLVGPGQRIVAGDDLYGGTRRLFDRVYAPMGYDFSYVDSADSAALAGAITADTKLVWLESPSNPLLKITDLAAAAARCREVGALLVVDNTFATPFVQRPLELGADLVVHSMTKYFGGHSDVVAGCVIGRDDGLRERLHFLQNSAGGVLGPHDSYLVHRGLKTLALRMERHCANAFEVAGYLAAHAEVERVYFPGLDSHPNHAVAKEQMRAFGGMVSFDLSGSVERANQVAMGTRFFKLAESLGGVESLIEVPAAMTHASVPPEVRREIGLADGLIRLSVGIEDVRDLIADIEQAIAGAG